ncbi:MAG TPA: cytochrome P450 [Acidimicrobiales bacterium]|nr:cytochrome P450 [Acidimicrobiales bacterium]
MPTQTPPTVPDLFSPEFASDPYAGYRRLRELGPVHDDVNDLWILSRHAHVLEALHQPTVFSSEQGYGQFMSGAIGPASGSARANVLGFDQMGGARLMIASDPPDHTALRRIVSRPFTKRRIAEWEDMARRLTADLVDDLHARIRDGGTADFTRDIAIPLPVTLIAEILGIPPAQMQDFRRWSDALVGSLAADIDVARVGADLAEMFQYFWRIAQERRHEPGEDLISAIAVATPDGEQLSTTEVVMFCVLLLVAGNETTTNLLGNLQHAFWDHPGEWRRLRDDLSLAPAAVEEALRYCGPVQGLFRRTTEPAVLGGTEIPAGADVAVLFASANRDEAVFEHPDRFVIGRPGAEHVALGHGVHYCLGAQLARLETRVVLEALAQRGVDLQPAGPAVRTANTVLQGYRSIPVTAG